MASKTLTQLSEFGWIDFLTSISRDSQKKGVLGIGDDAAVIPANESESYVVTTDMLVENRHFVLQHISAFDLGYKSVAVNLSDVAAMGAVPQFLFLSIAIKENTSTEWLTEFAGGLNACAQKYGAVLLGGDTVSTLDSLTINITAIGRAKNDRIKLRKNAQSGDIIAVTGFLGDSSLGLKTHAEPFWKRHVRPEPHVQEGIFLAEQIHVHAMMDVSDGIGSDLQRLTQSSKLGAKIDLEKLPRSPEFLELQKGDFELAVNGGEDYCLLVTIERDPFLEVSNAFENKFGRPLYEIGQITAANEIEYFFDQKRYEFKTKPWSHF